MIKPWLIGLVVVAIASGLVIVFIKNQQPALTSLPDGTVIYDVRTADEYARDHVVTAKHLALADLQAGTLPTEPKDASIAIYCQSGRRSAAAAEILKKAGYTNVIDMHGIEDTARYGLTIVK